MDLTSGNFHLSTSVREQFLVVPTKPLDDAAHNPLKHMGDFTVGNVKTYGTLLTIDDLIPYTRIIGIHLKPFFSQTCCKLTIIQ